MLSSFVLCDLCGLLLRRPQNYDHFWFFYSAFCCVFWIFLIKFVCKLVLRVLRRPVEKTRVFCKLVNSAVCFSPVLTYWAFSMSFPRNIKYLSRNCVYSERLGFALLHFRILHWILRQSELKSTVRFWFHFYQIVFWIENVINLCTGCLEVLRIFFYQKLAISKFVIVWQLVFDYDAEFLTAIAHWHVFLRFHTN